MALREARASGIEPVCITIDKQADPYLRRMYGDVRYIVIDRVEGLPEKLPRHLPSADGLKGREQGLCRTGAYQK